MADTDPSLLFGYYRFKNFSSEATMSERLFLSPWSFQVPTLVPTNTTKKVATHAARESSRGQEWSPSLARAFIGSVISQEGQKILSLCSFGSDGSVQHRVPPLFPLARPQKCLRQKFRRSFCQGWQGQTSLYGYQSIECHHGTD